MDSLLTTLLIAITFLNGLVVCSEQGVEEAVLNLPKTSDKFFALYSSKGPTETVDSLQLDKGDAFKRWVLWSIHTAKQPFWHIENKSHARVFDLLNLSRKQDLMPKPIDIHKICHKGMEHLQDEVGIDISIPPKPYDHIPTAMWSELWKSCHKKLSSKTRTASNCIDIPGVVVSSNDPNKSNNPCNKEYRMVDGAHRLCLRKYGLALLHGEVAELRALLPEAENVDDEKDIIAQIAGKERMIAKMSSSMYLEIDQEMFESILVYSDNPRRHHEEWVRTVQLSKEFIDEWKLWMNRVLAVVHDWSNNYPNSTTKVIEEEKNDEL